VRAADREQGHAGISGAISSISEPMAPEVMNAFAPQSVRMYSTSAAVSLVETQT
jgi:hypothetical protein